MKKLLITMCLIALSFNVVQGQDVNQPAEGMSFRILTEPSSQNTNVEGWIGFRKGNSEVGIIVGYIDEQTDKDASMTIGGFSAYHFPDIRPTIENTFWLTEWLPKEIVAEPSLGLAITYNLETYALKTSPFVALRVYETFEIQLGYEAFQSETVESDGFKIGLSTMWRF
jgi:hypothetical protein